MWKKILPLIPVVLFASCIIENLIPENIWNELDTYDQKNYRQVVKQDGRDFRILQLTDTHIGSYIMDDFNAVKDTFAIIEEAVKTNNPDMLILTGDNIIATGIINTLWAERLIVFLDSFKIPYVLAMGNHDGGGFFDAKNDNRKRITADVFASGKYSLFDKGPVNIGGVGNYGVNIVSKNGDVLYGIIVLDNGDNEFTARQTAWYEWYVKNLGVSVYGCHAPEEGKVVKTIAVYHVPLPETINVRQEMIKADPDMAEIYFGESPSTRGTSSGMFAKMKELKSTAYMFFGHDHKNFLCYQYEGIYFVYGLKTGSCAEYHKGTTLITLKDDLSISVEFLHK